MTFLPPNAAEISLTTGKRIGARSAGQPQRQANEKRRRCNSLVFAPASDFCQPDRRSIGTQVRSKVDVVGQAKKSRVRKTLPPASRRPEFSFAGASPSETVPLQRRDAPTGRQLCRFSRGGIKVGPRKAGGKRKARDTAVLEGSGAKLDPGEKNDR
uniref:Uncharacterized protein n=1 Tax=Trichuris muris TaxID=70415 RepID=A0A5S6QDL1_TRIMR